MLENIKLVDYFAYNVDFKQGHFLPDVGGNINFQVNDLAQFDVEDPKEGIDIIHFAQHVKVNVEAANKVKNDEQKNAFTLNMEIRLIYQAPNTVTHEDIKSIVEGSQWFFQNNGHLVAQQLAASFIEITNFKGTFNAIPKSPPRQTSSDS